MLNALQTDYLSDQNDRLEALEVLSQQVDAVPANVKNAWIAACWQLKHRLGDPTYSRVIQPLRLVDYDESSHCVTFLVASDALRERLYEQFADLIARQLNAFLHPLEVSNAKGLSQSKVAGSGRAVASDEGRTPLSTHRDPEASKKGGVSIKLTTRFEFDERLTM